MRPIIASYAFALVALARECGLKLHESCKGGCNFVIRSRKGAWIEIQLRCTMSNTAISRSREGAWIEIKPVPTSFIALPSLPQGSVD